MAFIGFGFMELLALAVLGGNIPADIVAFIPTKHYFQSRQVEVSIDNLMELAGKEPTESKIHFMQLMALKALTEDVANLKKSAKYGDHRKTLEAIAAGKQAQDPAGFAKEYGQRLLNEIDGRKTAPPSLPARAFEEALQSIPGNATFAAMRDHRGGREGVSVQKLISALQDLIPDDDKTKVYDLVEKIGNVQIDRLVSAFAEDAEAGPAKQQRTDMEIYLRITGKANRLWLAETMASLNNAALEHAKGPRGEIITFLKKNRPEPPALALWGNTELFIAGYSRQDQRDHGKLLLKMIDVHQGKADSVLKGPMADDLKKIPDKAHALAVGSLPEEMGRGAPFQFPKKILAHLVRGPLGQDFVADLTMENADKGKELVQMIGQGKTTGIGALKGLQDMAPPNVNLAAILGILESLQVQAKGNSVSVQMLLSEEGLISLPLLMFGLRN